MLERRLIRVLVAYNKTHYFVDKGVQRGAAYEAFKKFEDELNAQRKTGNLQSTWCSSRCPVKSSLQGLVEGRGDIAAATLTDHPRAPAAGGLLEPVCAESQRDRGHGAPNRRRCSSVDDLSGQEVFVRSLQQLPREPSAR